MGTNAVEQIKPGQSTPKLGDRMHWYLWVKHYNIRSEEVHFHWIERFIRFHAQGERDGDRKA